MKLRNEAVWSREIKDCCKEMQERYALWKEAMDKAKLKFTLTCTLRNDIVQEVLHMQGREPLVKVNEARFRIGLIPITEAMNKKPVTWIKKGSKHSLGKAIDYVLWIMNERGDDFIPHWNLKYNANDNEIPDYREACEIAESCGLISLGLKYGKDWCHLEV